MIVGLLCGGPSLERGISLNSARSVMDHLESESISIRPIYFDHTKKPYIISKAQLYSNTPSDFDFKLAKTGRPLSEKQLVAVLKKCDIVFPAMHGAFAEDGTIQSFLEKHNIPYVGSSSLVCKKVFDKYNANEYIREHGFFAPQSAVLGIYKKDHVKIINAFFKKYTIRRAIVKPASGGSSIGVFSVSTPKEALEKACLIFSKRMDTRVVIEPFAEGVEFTSIILQNRFGLPVAILPTEIQTDYTEHQIFDYRKKYLPTRQVTYRCPPSFSNDVIEKIQIQAEQLFSLFGMSDFARFDGWVMNDGNIWFSDFNPISGMEQNSFLFQQGSRIGMSHADVLRFIVRRACERQGISFPEEKKDTSLFEKKPVHVLFGGETSERHVSLMSGTNVWLKLRSSRMYDPKAFLLDKNDVVWELPYMLTLNHTVEEIAENCAHASADMERLRYLEELVQKRLGLREGEASQGLVLPRKMSLDEFIAQSPFISDVEREKNVCETHILPSRGANTRRSAFIFLALHGGDGESGALQKKLAERGVLFNGSDAHVSRLCMDKYATGERIMSLGISGVSSVQKKLVRLGDLKEMNSQDFARLWKNFRMELEAETLIVKPRGDGCSSGIVHLFGPDDLEAYGSYALSGAPRIPKGVFKNQTESIEMPAKIMDEIMFERFVETDIIRVKGNMLKHHRVNGWIEATVGVLVDRAGAVTVLSPSITVAEGEVLSVEEKFQGGTGVNITPPPKEIMRPSALKKVMERIGKLSEEFDIQGYARVDVFIHIDTGNVIVIEFNTLPALTPSTVLYQQALALEIPIYPRELLEGIIKGTGY